MLVEWNDTRRDYTEGCLQQFIEEQVERTPDAIALVFERKEVTYRDLNRRANRMARWLLTLGIAPEARVGICLERSIEMVITMLAIMKAGGVYVPLDPEYPRERLAYIINNADPRVVVTQKYLRDRLPDHEAHIICLDASADDYALFPEYDLECATELDNLVYVIYTSGSTGTPKGAMNTHRGIVNRLLWMQDTYELRSADRVIQKTPYGFDVSVWEFFWPLMTGARLVIAKPGGHRDSGYLVRLIMDQGITVLHFVPSMLQVFLDVPALKCCDSVRLVFCSGEALSADLRERCLSRWAPRLENLYGPTEAAIDVTYWSCNRENVGGKVPIGRPIANMQAYILDRNLEPVPTGTAGDLYISGIGLARGYCSHPRLTAEGFIPNPFGSKTGGRLYKTGDVARYLVDGNIEYLGRVDDQVKIRGNRVELGDIEAALRTCKGVRDAAVVAREDKTGDKRLIAYLIPERQPAPTQNGLRTSLGQKLPQFMIPSQYIFLDKLPVTAHGKVDRRSLPAPNMVRKHAADGPAPLLNKMEQELATLWEKLLGVRVCNRSDTFFELGGHSLLLTQLGLRIREVFGVELPLTILFDVITIPEMALAITELQLARLDAAEIADFL